MLDKLEDNDLCFACGKNNPIGLKLTFSLVQGEAQGTFVPHQNHQGYQGMMHGGLVATLLDEVMAHYLRLKGNTGVTGRLEIRFRHSVPLVSFLKLRAGLKKEKGNWVLLWSQLEDRGKILAQGEGLFYREKRGI